MDGLPVRAPPPFAPPPQRQRDLMSPRSKPPALHGPDAERYEVGYRKPPEKTRFKPGQSGNPGGRPKGSKNRQAGLRADQLGEIVLAEAYRPIRINDGDRQVSVPMIQAVVRSVAVNAVKGQPRAQRLFTEMVSATERANQQIQDDLLEVASTYKTDWERELDRRARLGITGPEPLPHPDHVIINFRTGTVEVRGPAAREEKVKWDMWIERRTTFQEELAELQADLDDPDCAYRDFVLDEIAHTRKVLAIVDRALEWRR